jgi:hypothetical protein
MRAMGAVALMDHADPLDQGMGAGTRNPDDKPGRDVCLLHSGPCPNFWAGLWKFLHDISFMCGGVCR